MKKQGLRPFWVSLGVTLFLLLTIAGFVTVDYQGRRLSFGDDDPPVHRVELPGGGTGLEIKLLGLEKQVDVTEIDKFWKLVLDFSCIPHN